MQYRRYGSVYAVRLDAGDEILESLAALAEKEGLSLAAVSGLGAAGEVTLGIFQPGEKQYYSQTFAGAYEISSLTGNITRMEGKPYLHLHITIGNPVTGECHAGHLSRAVISATAEIFITVLDGEAGRKFSNEVGLNLLEF